VERLPSRVVGGHRHQRPCQVIVDPAARSLDRLRERFDVVEHRIDKRRRPFSVAAVRRDRRSGKSSANT